MHDVPDIRVPAQRPRPAATRHEMWCSNHVPGVDASDFGTCMADDLAAGDAWAGLSANTDGVRIDFGFPGRGSDLDDAERFALAILCQVARGRGLTPPASMFAAVGS